MSYALERQAATEALKASGRSVSVTRGTSDAYDPVTPSRSVIESQVSVGAAHALFLPVSKARLGRFAEGSFDKGVLSTPVTFALITSEAPIQVCDTVLIDSTVKGTIVALSPLDPDGSGVLVWYVLISHQSQQAYQGVDLDTLFADGFDDGMLATEDGEVILADT